MELHWRYGDLAFLVIDLESSWQVMNLRISRKVSQAMCREDSYNSEPVPQGCMRKICCPTKGTWMQIFIYCKLVRTVYITFFGREKNASYH